MIGYRDAVPADGPELDAMAREAWVETFGTFYADADRDAYLATDYGPAGNLLRDLADPQVAFRLACADGRIVGYAKLNPPWLADAEPGALQLSQIYVLSPWLGAGVGPVLMDWAVEAARARGATSLLLTVWEENHRAHRFYVRRGFTHIGDYAFPVGEKIDRDLILRLAL
jgi:GNAT superfamily N-acetyltransferase